MSSVPTLYLWNPNLEREGKELSFLLSPFGATNDIVQGRGLAQHVLDRLGISGQPVSWKVYPICTSYFAAGGSEGPEHWRLVWSMVIELDHRLEQVPALRHDYLEISEGGTFVPGARGPCADVPYWVVCDFDDEATALAAGNSIRQHQGDTRMVTVNLNDQFTQLQADLGTRPPHGFQTMEAWALAAEQLCRDHGGIPNNDEREDEWDVVFHDGGIE